MTVKKEEKRKATAVNTLYGKDSHSPQLHLALAL